MTLHATLRILWLTALLVAGVMTPAAAQQDNPAGYAQRLKAYDPEAVSAALAYSQEFNMKGMFEKAIPALRVGVAKQIKSKNPKLNQADLERFTDAFFKSAFIDNGDVLEQATVLMMLDILSKDELVALRDFYGTPVGKSILTKMPILMGRMPELMGVLQKYVFPRALESARDELRKNGVSVQL